MRTDVVIDGAGLTGIACARILAERGRNVLILERRNYIGGNCFDSVLNGVMVHNYGPHCFRTNNADVWEFANRFSIFNDFIHRVQARLDNGLIIPIPFNLKSQEIISEYWRKMGVRISFDEKHIKEMIMHTYSEKQWGMSYDKIPARITARVPLCRQDYEDRYCVTNYAGIPMRGYTEWLCNMKNHPLINVALKCGTVDWESIRKHNKLLIYTGKIDEFFNYCYGRLPYRSLNFVHSTALKRIIPIINECNRTVDYTRSYDHSHFLNQDGPQTIITQEYPCAHDTMNIPFYPIPTDENLALYSKYKELADKEKGVMFIGRLAEYSYMDMDVAILNVINKLGDI